MISALDDLMPSIAEVMRCMPVDPFSTAVRVWPGNLFRILRGLGIAPRHAGHFLQRSACFLQRRRLLARTFGELRAGRGKTIRLLEHVSGDKGNGAGKRSERAVESERQPLHQPGRQQGERHNNRAQHQRRAEVAIKNSASG